MAARVANSTALRFSTGNAPGKPRHTGQTFVLGGSPKRVEQEQKILVAVRSWTWTSSPMTGSYLARAATEMSDVVAISSDYKGFPALSRIRVRGHPLVRLSRRAQVFLQRDFEIHQFISLGIAHAGQIEVRSRQRRRNPGHAKEHKTRLRAVWFNRLGG